jgi:hypothetical protein
MCASRKDEEDEEDHQHQLQQSLRKQRHRGQRELARRVENLAQ